MKSSIYAVALFSLFTACNPTTPKQEEEVVEPTPVETPTFTYDNITPVNFPQLNIPGFAFPEDSTVLNGWIYNDDQAAINLHGWGIWTGLTMETNQTTGGHVLRVFETWQTPEEIAAISNGRPANRVNRANLEVPRQFIHNTLGNQTIDTADWETFVNVAYSPAAAQHATSNKLFNATTLLGYVAAGQSDIPDFPHDAITIKPTFVVLPTSTSSQDKFALITWHGPTTEEKGYPPTDWNTIVYVDITNQSSGDGSQITTTPGQPLPAPTPEASYNLNDFIHYTLTEEDAHFFNEEYPNMQANVGDKVLLVAMHVTTKENKRWTWQSYWWAPDADNPPAPSSPTIASARPAQLVGAPRHYAMAIAYYMVNPQEPYVGSNVIGEPTYAFNPYLEASFTGFGSTGASLSVVNTPNGSVSTNAGVRTNCMSCHVMASVNGSLLVDPNNFKTKNYSQTPYIGNAYVSLLDPIFNGQLKVDFAWSIEGNVDTTGLAAYLAANHSGN